MTTSPVPHSSAPATRAAARAAARSAERPRPDRRHLLVAGGVLATLLVVVAWSLLRPQPGGLVEVDRYPATAPAEWGPDAAWASPPLLPDTRPVVIGSDLVLLLTAERDLLAVSATDGAVRWRAPVPDGEVRTPPAPTRIGGVDVVAAHVGSDLVWWSAADGEDDAMTLPDGAVVTMVGSVPLVALGARSVAAVTGAELQPVEVPDGAVAMAAHEDGQITAGGQAGWWHLRAGGPGTFGAWDNAAAGTAGVAGYTGGFVLLLRGGDPASLEVHADRTGDVSYVFGGPVVLPGGPGSQVTWAASPTGTWGILGRTLVDLRGGRLEDLGAWSTRTVTADRAYGHIDGRTVVVGPHIARGLLDPQEAIPDALTTAGALVRGPDPAADAAAGVDPRRTADVVYLLPPRRTAS